MVYTCPIRPARPAESIPAFVLLKVLQIKFCRFTAPPSLWVLASRPANCLRVSFLRKKRAFFGHLKGLVVGDSLKFFERDFMRRSVELFKC
jgi:hypothetical protein